MESIKTLHPIINRVLSNSNFKIEVINSFLDDKILVDNTLHGRPIDKIKSNVYECTCHGDLHTRNILIRIDNQPFLIDPARRIECRHWASDVARLCADLWISAWDAGPEAYLWDSLSQWEIYISNWLSEVDISSSVQDHNKPVYLVLVWLRENFNNIFQGCFSDEIPIWEFKLALAVELLNLCGYENIPTPKRCFGILAANDILTQLHSDIPWT